jgi:glycosyltransferase 2 family protein
MAKKKIYQAIFFLIIGLVAFWLVYRDTNIRTLKNELGHFKWSWIGISIGLNLFSQWIRAIRWKMLFTPLDYHPKTYNLFLSLIVLTFTNQIIPRGGEITRLGAVNKYENIPFPKLFGVALIERLIDFIVLMLIFVLLLIWQFAQVKELLSLPEINFQGTDLKKPLIILGLATGVVLLSYLAFKKLALFNRFRDKMKTFKLDIKDGFSSFMHIDQKALFLFLSVMIYAIWLFMLYVLVFAYPPTDGLSFKAAAFTFGWATLAFLLPIQAGMGAWHFIVIQCLLMFGVAESSGKVFSLVAHVATNFVFLPIGLMAIILLPVLNNRKA